MPPRLRDYLLTADERAVFRANPRELGRALGLGQREALALLGCAAEERLVDLNWEIHCPECQRDTCVVDQAQGASRPLSCRFCNHDYDLRIEHEVRLTFTVRPDVRPLSAEVDDADYRHRLDEADGPVNAFALLNIPLFREHFAAAVLREGSSLRVRQLTILATDLTNSTTFYSRDGDVMGYEIIRDHFRRMTALAETHSGFVLKTLGDGVLACFPETLSGLRAAVDIQREMSAFWSKHNVRDNEPHVLRIGLHAGPSILVAPDQQLDVFGATINIAFRVARLARGGDILVTNTALDLDPAARRELESLGPTETFQTVLKGFDEDCTIHRLIPPTN